MLVKTKTQKMIVVLLYLAKRSGVRFSRSGIIHTYLGGGVGGGGDKVSEMPTQTPEED